jgi:hypothetical protein
VIKWWDWFWGAVWMIGSAFTAYLTGRWFAHNASPADLGALRYGLIAFSGLFGLLVGAFCLSIAIIGITTGIEWIFARLGYPMRPPAAPAEPAETATGTPVTRPAAAMQVEAPGDALSEAPGK